MATYPISASKEIAASAQRIYPWIADYRNGHPQILPKPYFLSLDVKEGGYGEGTVVDFQMNVMGRIQSFHSVITEPIPGRVLVETDLTSGSVTTFTLDPAPDGQKTAVTITTTIQVPNGLLGKLQGWLTAQVLRPIYLKELSQLAALATEKTALNLDP